MVKCNQCCKRSVGLVQSYLSLHCVASRHVPEMVTLGREQRRRKRRVLQAERRASAKTQSLRHWQQISIDGYRIRICVLGESHGNHVEDHWRRAKLEARLPFLPPSKDSLASRGKQNKTKPMWLIIIKQAHTGGFFKRALFSLLFILEVFTEYLLHAKYSEGWNE